jgi:hypothetical protein
LGKESTQNGEPLWLSGTLSDEKTNENQKIPASPNCLKEDKIKFAERVLREMYSLRGSAAER